VRAEKGAFLLLGRFCRSDAEDKPVLLSNEGDT
jgi:hypothetical protein